MNGEIGDSPRGQEICLKIWDCDLKDLHYKTETLKEDKIL